MGNRNFSYDSNRKEMNKTMKKVLTVLLMIALSILILTNLGNIIGLAITLAVLYFAFKQYIKSTSVFGKILWGIIGLIALVAGLGNFMAIVGIIAIYLLSVVYKDWKQNHNDTSRNQDPFTNFEKQWEQMNKNNL